MLFLAVASAKTTGLATPSSGFLMNCGADEFACMFRCIPQSKRCDVVADCFLSQDEAGCDTANHVSEGSSFKTIDCGTDFLCSSTDTCVAASVVCDSRGDCALAEDEATCNYNLLVVRSYPDGDISCAKD